MTTVKETQRLATKLAAIGKEIGAVSKSGKNLQQKYDYIEYSVVAGRIRELLDKYHVAIVPNVEHIQQDEVENKYGSKGYHYVLHMSFEIINGDDESDKEMATWAGEAIDYGDKGINKAETAGTKYFLMRLFNISEKGDDNDANTPDAIAASKPVPKFSDSAIGEAKLKLGTCNDMVELKNAYKSLGEIAKDPEIIKYTNTVKARLEN